MKTIEELLGLGVIKRGSYQYGFNDRRECYFYLKISYGYFMPGQLVWNEQPVFEDTLLNESWQKEMFSWHWEAFKEKEDE